MNYKQALEIAKKSVQAARQNLSDASNVLDVFRNEKARGLWGLICALDTTLFHIHYDIIETFAEDNNE